MSTPDEIPPIRMHLVSTDVPLAGTPPRRRRRALRTNTYTLTAANPTQAALPQADNRLEAWITSAVGGAGTAIIYVSTSQAGAAAQGGGAAQISGIDTTPFPVNTTDQVWISAAAGLPVSVSVVAIYDEADVG